MQNARGFDQLKAASDDIDLTPEPGLQAALDVSNTFRKKADEIFGDGKYAPGYYRTYWEGCTHGFTVRGDMVGGSRLFFRVGRLR